MNVVARVLVIDDVEDIRLLMRQVLVLAGCDVVEATSGIEGLEVLGRDPGIDIVVLDVQMPDIDGWTVLERIRSGPRAAEVGVLLCSVKRHLKDRARAWELGADGYLTKPFGIEDLRDAVLEIAARAPADRPRHRVAQLSVVQREGPED